MTPESLVKKHITAILMKRNAYYLFPVANMYTKKGVPDIIVCYHGRFLGIEAKATARDKPTMIQLYNHKQIQEAGGMVMVIHEDNIEELEEWLDEVDHEEVE